MADTNANKKYLIVIATIVWTIVVRGTKSKEESLNHSRNGGSAAHIGRRQEYIAFLGSGIYAYCVRRIHGLKTREGHEQY